MIVQFERLKNTQHRYFLTLESCQAFIVPPFKKKNLHPVMSECNWSALATATVINEESQRRSVLAKEVTKSPQQ